jgi:hypothetical protein
LNRKHENAHPGPRPVVCDLAAHAAVRVPLATVGDLRRRPGPPGVAALPANFLKHADDQTVVGLAAIFHAIANHKLHDVPFTAWGVLAAPRFLARAAMITGLQRFLAEGAWGVSPHTIPHRSLHSISGTVSHALQIRGPNFGVGGGHGGNVEVLVAAVSLLERGRLPGIWVVWTAQEPDGEMDLAGHGDPNTICRALAVALTPTTLEGRAPRLQLEVGGAPTDNPLPCKDFFYLETLINKLGAARDPGRKVAQDLDVGVRVGLEWPGRVQPAVAGAGLPPALLIPAACASPTAEAKP